MTPRINRRRAGILGAVVGLAAAGVAAGVAAERYVVRRSRGVPDPHVDEPFGDLPSDAEVTIGHPDGFDLHVEVVDADTGDQDLTVLFVHGFCLDMGTFHFQRRALSGTYRMVFYDQPGHGRSGRLDRGEYTLDSLAGVLRSVIDRLVPTGRIVLVGHSMGGMTIMACAERWPRDLAERVVGVAFISTSAGQMKRVSFGMPQVVAQVRGPLIPVVRAAGPTAAGAFDLARRATGDLVWLLTKKYGFGSPNPSPALVSYVERMNSATSLDVISRYLGTIHNHDRVRALGALARIPVLVVCGDRDLITPLEHSQAIARALPHAEFAVIPHGGHVALLEHSDQVNALLEDFLRRCADPAAVTSLRGDRAAR